MKDIIKKFATKLNDYELETYCAYPYYKLANNKMVDMSKIICESLSEEGIFAEAENDGIYILNLNNAKEKLANRIWLEEKIIKKIAAKSKKISFTKDECKHQVEAGTEEAKKKGINKAIPGRIYCYLWNTQIENVVQINGRCVPIRFLTQSTPDSGTNQWGNGEETSEGKPLGNIKSRIEK